MISNPMHHRCKSLFMVLGLCCLLTACDAVERDWKKTKAEDSITSYEGYLAAHPDSPHAQEARENIEYLHWEVAVNEDTAQSYRQYLQDYNDGAHADIARMKLDDQAWSLAASSNTLPGYKQYYDRYPNTQKLSSLRLTEKSQWFAESPLSQQLQGNLSFTLSVRGLKKDGAFHNVRVDGVEKLLPEQGKWVGVSGTLISQLNRTVRKTATINRWTYIYRNGQIVDWAVCATRGEIILPRRGLFGYDQNQTIDSRFEVMGLGEHFVHITVTTPNSKICFTVDDNDQVLPAIFSGSQLITHDTLFSKQNEEWAFAGFYNR